MSDEHDAVNTTVEDGAVPDGSDMSHDIWNTSEGLDMAWVLLIGFCVTIGAVGMLVSHYIDKQVDIAAIEAGYVQEIPERGYRPVWVKPDKQ